MRSEQEILTERFSRLISTLYVQSVHLDIKDNKSSLGKFFWPRIEFWKD